MSVADAGGRVLTHQDYEYEWRLSTPGYGAGWFPIEELRRLGVDDPFAGGQPIVWQARIGAAAIVDTVLVTPDAAWRVTPCDQMVWPFKRMTLNGRSFDIPDILIRSI
jgi:hypothetical protein